MAYQRPEPSRAYPTRHQRRARQLHLLRLPTVGEGKSKFAQRNTIQNDKAKRLLPADRLLSGVRLFGTILWTFKWPMIAYSEGAGRGPQYKFSRKGIIKQACLLFAILNHSHIECKQPLHYAHPLLLFRLLFSNFMRPAPHAPSANLSVPEPKALAIFLYQ